MNAEFKFDFSLDGRLAIVIQNYVNDDAAPEMLISFSSGCVDFDEGARFYVDSILGDFPVAKSVNTVHVDGEDINFLDGAGMTVAVIPTKFARLRCEEKIVVNDLRMTPMLIAQLAKHYGMHRAIVKAKGRIH